MSVSETEAGRALVADWAHINTCLIEWILKLAEFDRDALWAIDGFHNCVSWLEIKCEMARSTAFEKVRVAHELTRRPVIRAALAAGDLPFTKAQAITRLEGLNDERDSTFVADAADSPIRALENRVKNWNHFNGNDTTPDIHDHYGIRRIDGFMDGYGQLIVEAPNDMVDRLLGIVDAYGNFLFHNGPSQLRLKAVDESRNGTRPQAGYDDADPFEDSEELPKRPPAGSAS